MPELTFTAHDVAEMGAERMHTMLDTFVQHVGSCSEKPAAADSTPVAQKTRARATAATRKVNTTTKAAPAAAKAGAKATSSRRLHQYLPPKGVDVVPGTKWYAGRGEPKEQTRELMKRFGQEQLKIKSGAKGAMRRDVVQAYEEQVLGVSNGHRMNGHRGAAASAK